MRIATRRQRACTVAGDDIRTTLSGHTQRLELVVKAQHVIEVDAWVNTYSELVDAVRQRGSGAPAMVHADA